MNINSSSEKEGRFKVPNFSLSSAKAKKTAFVKEEKNSFNEPQSSLKRIRQEQ